MTSDETEPGAGPNSVLRGLWFILAPLLALGMVAMAAGIVVGATQAGKFGTGFFIALGLAALALAGAAWLIRRILPAYALPRSPRMRQARLLLYLAGLLGALLGAVMIVLQGGEPLSTRQIMRGEAPLPAPIAIVLAAATVLSLVLSVRWHSLLDEHERAAYDFGAVVALYVYFGLTALWWLLWRAALVPAPDGLAILIAVTTAWMLAWLVRRFR